MNEKEYQLLSAALANALVEWDDKLNFNIDNIMETCMADTVISNLKRDFAPDTAEVLNLVLTINRLRKCVNDSRLEMLEIAKKVIDL